MKLKKLEEKIQSRMKKQSKIISFYFRELEDKIDKLKIDLEFKTQENYGMDLKHKETKAEYKILQNTFERLNMVNKQIRFIFIYFNFNRIIVIWI